MSSPVKCFCAALMTISPLARAAEIHWQPSGPGLAMTRFTNSGPVIFAAIRIELESFDKDFTLITTLASNQIVGTAPLLAQINALPKNLGTPVAAMNADFFMMSGAAKGDPRGLHIWRGELVSVPTGPAAFWRDPRGKLHGEPVSSRLTISWPGGGTNLCGLNEQLRTNTMVLFTPRMGRLNSDRTTTNTANSPTGRPPRTAANTGIPQGGPLRPPGGREYILEHTGTGPWLPLRVGHIYHAKIVGSSNALPPGKMLLMLGSNFIASWPDRNPTNKVSQKVSQSVSQNSDPLTHLPTDSLPRADSPTDLLPPGTPVTITVATDPDLTGVDEALGTGPMLVRDGRTDATMAEILNARMSEQLHPRAALGWNKKYLYLATADGRQKGISIGLKLSEMADYMIELGCDEAINMDGGQSTTLWLDGKTINQQSSGLHAVANAIVVLRRPSADRELPED